MADAAEVASLEAIVGALFAQEEVDRAVVTALWAVVATAPDRAAAASASASAAGEAAAGPSLSGALGVLAMVARMQPDGVTAAKVRFGLHYF